MLEWSKDIASKARQPQMGRAPCCDKASVKKGPWSPEEDAKLKSFIEKHGTGGNWITLPQKMGLMRCGKSCRLRWLNYLRPNIKHGGFTEEEEGIICSLYLAIGSRWSVIASQLPGRTDNDIKNYWNTKLKKKLLAKLQRRETHQQPISGRNLQLQETMNESHPNCCSSLLGKDQLLSRQNHSNNLVDPAAAVSSQLSQIFQQTMNKLGGMSRDQEQYSENRNYADFSRIDPFLELLGQLPHTADHDGLLHGRGSATANTTIAAAAAHASVSMNWDEVIISPMLVQCPVLSLPSSEEPVVPAW